MDTISAIETSYKGYRFRSRLEARWAMFFDRVGVTWTHEPQPLRVAGEPYLPDFLVSLPGGEVVHEVKSLHECNRIQPRRVYLAGKMKSEHDWRGSAAPTRRSDRTGAAYRTTAEDWASEAAIAEMGGAHFMHVGPFSLSDDHGSSHAQWVRHMAEGWASEGPLPGHQIAQTCLETIVMRSDLVCAHFSTPDAFGTLIELGFAKALALPICVTVDAALAESMTRPPSDEDDHNAVGAHDLWFAEAVATRSAIVDGFAEAQAVHGQFIRERTPREYRLISGIGAERAAAMTFGDPLDVANRGQIHDWGSGIARLCIANRAAAEAVRAHRFDGR